MSHCSGKISWPERHFRYFRSLGISGYLPARIVIFSQSLYDTPSASSLIAAEPISSLQPDLPTKSSSPSLAEKRPAEKRPSKGVASQGKDKRARTSPEHVDLPKNGIPPPPFPDHGPLMAPGFFTSEFLEKPYIFPGGQKTYEGTFFKSNLQSFHAMRPLLMEGLWRGIRYRTTWRWGMLVSSCSGGLAASTSRTSVFWLRSPNFVGLGTLPWLRRLVRGKRASEYSFGCCQGVQGVPRVEDALSATIERFKKSPEFLDALGANSAYGAFSFVKKYKEKYPDLRSDYAKFQEDYKGSWFANLDLGASSSDDIDEEDVAPTGDAPSPA
ncbi:hypothetical protein LIER_15357 [Lithospermum erythrorhizon]|uniref:Uncharacterized protein n=1 Tax=Lithospermum erythrorhizon TaxID=34254 RepID=A0AAV3Q525_LITER